ncbi:MAG: exosortase/archaeosortase family protein [Gemmatimonadota bacterium]|nr:exosortase/archaeosortase family protein [Gemmatimonadota bacterium]
MASPRTRGTASVTAVLPWLLLVVAFGVLFWRPAMLLGRDWWNDPESGHGLLLAPVSLWLAWKSGLLPGRSAAPVLGAVLLVAAVLLRGASDLAAELFIMRMSMVMALVGLVIFYWGVRQALSWWLPFTLVALSVPLPELLRSAIAVPLQFIASQMGAALLEWRQIPVRLAGNIIDIPGHRLFVAEACSGLRSLTALLALGVLMGGMWLRYPVSRIALLVLAVPIAIAVNGVRVFLTGFLVYFVDPALGDGFMHLTEGWLLFLVSFLLTVGVAGLVKWIETALHSRWRTDA